MDIFTGPGNASVCWMLARLLISPEAGMSGEADAQLTAFFTRAAIRASSTGVSSFSA